MQATSYINSYIDAADKTKNMARLYKYKYVCNGNQFQVVFS